MPVVVTQTEGWIKELGVSDSQQYQKSAQESLSTQRKVIEEASQLQHQLGEALSTAPAVWANKLAVIRCMPCLLCKMYLMTLISISQ